MSRYARRAGELRVAVHTSHRVGETVGSGSGSHVVGVQRAACSSAGRDREVLLAVLVRPLLVGSGNEVLEAGRVGRVTGDRYVDALVLHDSHALEHVVRAVALDLSLVAVRVCLLVYDLKLVVVEIIIGADIGEAVDARDDERSVLAETVKDYAERLFSYLVSGSRDTDSALCGRERLVSCKEAEALRLLAEQHCAEVAVSETDLAVLCDRAGYAERLKSDTDSFSGVGGAGRAFLYSYGAAESVSPNRVVERYRLYALDDFFYVYALCKADISCLFEVGDSVFGEALFNACHSSFLAFKCYVVGHCWFLLSYCFLGSIYLAASSYLP